MNDELNYDNNIDGKLFLAEHIITKKLIAIGVTSEQLDQIKFRNHRGDLDSWACTWPNDLPLEAVPYIKPYCALHWLCSDSSQAESERSKAWDYIALATAADEVRAQDQRIKASKPRNQIINSVIETLALSYPNESAKILWRRLSSALTDKGIKVLKETEHEPGLPSIDYSLKNKSGVITFKRFKNNVSAFRAGQKSL